MIRQSGRSLVALMLVAGGCLFAREAATAQAAGANLPGRYPTTKADADFMQGMIAHHAQAVVMANWAPSHGASPSVQVLCARIALSQHDDIIAMQNWLRVRGYVVPDTNGRMPMASMSGMAGMPAMGGSDTGMVMFMPGMLTPTQMKMLDAARGPEWDRLFLTFMIQHHNGALAMVDTLFASPGGGQDDDIFKFATAVHADQTAEIDRMEAMLEGRPIEGGHD